MGSARLRNLYSNTAPAVSPLTYHMSQSTLAHPIPEDLQIEGIISRDPSPVPLEGRDIDELSLEEAHERLHRQDAELRAQVRIKKEKRDHAAEIEAEGDDESDDVANTGSSSRLKRPRLSDDSGVEIIDLTGDN